MTKTTRDLEYPGSNCRHPTCATCEEQFSALLARVKELEEAIEPFAKACVELPASVHDSRHLWYEDPVPSGKWWSVLVTVGDIRRAHSVSRSKT